MESQLIETPKSDEVREYKMLIGGDWLDARVSPDVLRTGKQRRHPAAICIVAR
jgi:hypothetical protein